MNVLHEVAGTGFDLHLMNDDGAVVRRYEIARVGPAGALVAFLRDSTFNVYSRAERLAPLSPSR